MNIIVEIDHPASTRHGEVILEVDLKHCPDKDDIINVDGLTYRVKSRCYKFVPPFMISCPMVLDSVIVYVGFG